MNCYTGEVLSEGIALGKAHRIYLNQSEERSFSIEEEQDKFEQALKTSIAELKEIREAHQENYEYLSMQILLLEDPNLKEKSLQEIERGASAIEAITHVICEYMNSLLDATSSYLKERVLDLSDVKNRVLRHLSGTKVQRLDAPFILISEELHPSFLIQNKEHILGIITSKGGYSSHGAILCRQFNIPYMVASIEAEENSILILDTRKKRILTAPTSEEVEYYDTLLKSLSEEKFFAVSHPNFQFLANVSDNIELDKVVSYGFDGIGLYRTEMIFMNSDRPFTLDEQYEIYSMAIEQMKGKRVCFRTFDIGDDKQLAYVKASKKGIDNYIHNPILFKTQIEALLKANSYNTMRIMFPMIRSAQEFEFLKKWVLHIQKEMKNTSHVEFGIMLETKEALEDIETFQDVHFISVGTNDLIYSIYHIHRDKQKNELEQYLNDLLFQLSRVVQFCSKEGIDLSICGELAAIGPALREFVKIGVKSFSVAAPAIKVLNHIYKEFF